METLIHQKVCKGNSFFKITKVLGKKIEYREQNKDLIIRSEWLGHFWKPYSRFPSRTALPPIGAIVDLY